MTLFIGFAFSLRLIFISITTLSLLYLSIKIDILNARRILREGYIKEGSFFYNFSKKRLLFYN